MRDPVVSVRSRGMLLSDATQAEARRCLRRMGAGHPAVSEWRICVQRLALPGRRVNRVLATVSAHSASGVTVARAAERDARGALRAAFGDLEDELHAPRARVWAWAARWLLSVWWRLR